MFASHLNAHLVGDPFLKHIVPLDPGGADFFDSFRDGVLMCRIVCLAIPGSIGASADLKPWWGCSLCSLKFSALVLFLFVCSPSMLILDLAIPGSTGASADLDPHGGAAVCVVFIFCPCFIFCLSVHKYDNTSR